MTLCGVTHGQIVQMTQLAKQTVTDYMAFTRQLVSEDIEEAKLKIGGFDDIPREVEIDESMFAKRKYNMGKRKGNGLWVFGGVEKRMRPGETKRRYFVCIVPDRTKETLKTAILAYIEQGSIITSDCWAAYKWLSEADSEKGSALPGVHWSWWPPWNPWTPWPRGQRGPPWPWWPP